MSDRYCPECGECNCGEWAWCRVCREWICPACRRRHKDDHVEIAQSRGMASATVCEALLYTKNAYFND